MRAGKQGLSFRVPSALRPTTFHVTPGSSSRSVAIYRTDRCPAPTSLRPRARVSARPRSRRTTGASLPAKQSAGILLYRESAGLCEVLLVHPGGPFWAKKDDGAWSIPKGEFTDEAPLVAALRELQEEIGLAITAGEAIALTPLRQPSGKLVHAWAVRGDFDPAALKSNTFSMEWPPRSGRQQEYPEVDRAGWFDLETAERKLLKGQVGFLHQLRSALEGDAG